MESLALLEIIIFTHQTFHCLSEELGGMAVHMQRAPDMRWFRSLPVSECDLEPCPRFFRIRRELKIGRDKPGIRRQAHATSALLADVAIMAARGVMWRSKDQMHTILTPPLMQLLRVQESCEYLAIYLFPTISNYLGSSVSIKIPQTRRPFSLALSFVIFWSVDGKRQIFKSLFSILWFLEKPNRLESRC